jgi:hypothetical protein
LNVRAPGAISPPPPVFRSASTNNLRVIRISG